MQEISESDQAFHLVVTDRQADIASRSSARSILKSLS